MVVLFILIAAALTNTLASDDEDLDIVTEAPIPVTEVEAVLGATVKLPCDLSLPTDNDRLSLIIWYKNGAKTPIYSLDVRERGLGQGKEIKQTEGAMSYSTNFPESVLMLEGVRDQDRGLYKCRVDFKHSPTRNAHVNLSIIVPPTRVTLADYSGHTLPQSTVGPVAEGVALEVVCIAHGGWPSPRLTWWQDNDMIDDSMDQPQEGRVSNTLTINPVTRGHLDSKLECRANNSPLLDPIVVLLTLDILLIPVEVRLVVVNMPLSAGSTYEVACRSVGSKPPPSITWWRSGKQLQAPTRVVTSEDGNVTTSTISLTVSMEDHGHTLSCRAVNPHIPSSALEDSWTLNTHYRPVARVEVGSSLNTSTLREGMDVYLECNVDANPQPSKIQWIHDGKPVTNNASAGLLITNHTLVLQAVRREGSGVYECSATNIEGETKSPPYNLNIKFEPKCKESQQRVYGAARLEELVVSCEVDANPSAVEFHWLFNNSVIHEKPVEGSVSSGGGGDRSEARYTAFSETDFGTLLCWARNDVGSQIVPCVFHIVPAGVPDPPYNCSVANRSQNWVHVNCWPGFDGGLPQQFTAELWRAGKVVSNTTSRSLPEFTLTSLEPGATYTVFVYSSNVKGRSSHSVSVETSTLGHTQTHRRVTPDSSLPTMNPLLLVISGIVIGVLLMVGLVLVAIVCVKRRSIQGSPEVSSIQLDKTHSLLSITVPSTTHEDDCNPDVIPHKTEGETTLLSDTGEAIIEAQWISATGISATVALPKEALLPDAWGVSVWPSGTPLQKLVVQGPVQRNAGTQTLVHKESTV
ncbi:nephrin-like [Macrosteles quadrilineatus]|uniref:nephrin-like n=1 Tax=Macrosteles quadrilineatus TaxID=74068 RepID=UPI0023E0DE53|nr:nephrin-like [Macrosteles quadrilineatus]